MRLCWGHECRRRLGWFGNHTKSNERHHIRTHCKNPACLFSLADVIMRLIGFELNPNGFFLVVARPHSSVRLGTGGDNREVSVQRTIEYN